MEAAVRASGGAKRDTVAQSPESVASVIVGLIESGANGKVVRVMDNKASVYQWYPVDEVEGLEKAAEDLLRLYENKMSALRGGTLM